MKKIILLATHGAALAVGFALGVYFLPILIQPPSPNIAQVESELAAPAFVTTFDRSREDSDRFHWGEGELRLYDNTIVFEGELAPGPDYRLYLTTEFVETESSFNAIKDQALEVGSVKNFDRFVFENVTAVGDPRFNTAVVWCETFGEFITSGQYRR